MKKGIVLLAIGSLLLFGACNKNKKFNKTLNGSWTTTTVDGVSVSASDASTFSFSKSGSDNGKVTMTSLDGGVQNLLASGNYTISNKGKTLTIDATGTWVPDISKPSSTIPITYHSSGSISNQSDSKFTYNVTLKISGVSNASSVVEFTRK